MTSGLLNYHIIACATLVQTLVAFHENMNKEFTCCAGQFIVHSLTLLRFSQSIQNDHIRAVDGRWSSPNQKKKPSP